LELIGALIGIFKMATETKTLSYHKENEEDILRLLHSLKVLATVQENDRIQTRNGIHVAAANQYFSFLHRWLFAESRQTNLVTIKSIFDQSFLHCQKICEELKALKELTEVESESYCLEPHQILLRLQMEIRNALKGLKKLKTTYINDSHSSATISLIEDTVLDKLDLIRAEFYAHGLNTFTAVVTPPGMT
jgi:hypothetical protein